MGTCEFFMCLQELDFSFRFQFFMWLYGNPLPLVEEEVAAQYVCVLVLISLSLSLSLHFHFSLNLRSPFFFQSQVCYLDCVYLQKPHAIVNHWCHHVNLANRNKPSPSLSLSFKMNTSSYLFWIPYPFYLFVCDPFWLFCVCSSTPSTPSFKCGWFMFVHVCKSSKRKLMTMVVLVKKKMNNFDPSQCINI